MKNSQEFFWSWKHKKLHASNWKMVSEQIANRVTSGFRMFSPTLKNDEVNLVIRSGVVSPVKNEAC